MEKKIIRSSNLCLRFYLTDGWIKQEIEECLEYGKVCDPRVEDGVSGYFILELGGQFNIKKLLSKCSKLHRAFDDYPDQTDEQFIEGHM